MQCLRCQRLTALSYSTHKSPSSSWSCWCACTLGCGPLGSSFILYSQGAMYQVTTLSLSSTLPMSKQQSTLAGMVLFFLSFFGLFGLFKHLHCIFQCPKVSCTLIIFFQCFHKVKEYLCLFLFSWKHYYHPCLACAVIINLPPAS